MRLIFFLSLLVSFHFWAFCLKADEASLPVGSKRLSIASASSIYFKGDDNRRERTYEVELPASTQDVARVLLHFKLSCPKQRCDAWDRLGSFGLLGDKGQYLELMRFITPYGVGAEWSVDLTDFLPLLEGRKTFRAFIDTWVGPGHPQGEGWLLDVELEYIPGYLAERPIWVEPFLSFEDIVYGDPSRTTARESEVWPLLGASSAKLVMMITGHGQGNLENCAEFCPKNHSVQIGEAVFSHRVWRDNCASTVDPTQKGNFRSPRAGWCPGDKVDPWTVDITEALLGDTLKLRYDVESYENTCRPGVSSCKGCVFGTACAYDGGLHTEPRYYVSSYVVYLRSEQLK